MKLDNKILVVLSASIIIVFFSERVFSQTTYENEYFYDENEDITGAGFYQTTNKGFLLLGSDIIGLTKTTSLLKTDSAGEIVSAEQIAIKTNTIASMIIGLSDSLYYICGTTYESTSSTDTTFVFIMKNSGGLVETFLLSNIHYYNLSYAIKTSNNKIALCGNGRKFNETTGGGYLTLITQSGELLWTTLINDDDPTTTEAITSVVELQNGYYMAVGTVRSNVMLNLPYKLFVVLINNNGLIEKSRVIDNYFEDGSTENPVICSNNVTSMVSATISPYYTGPRSIWLLKIDHFCDTLWTKPLTVENSSRGVGSITKTNTGHFILSGNAVIPNSTSPYPAFLAKIDSNGTQLWSNTFSGATSTSFTYCKESVDGGLAAIGQTISNGLFRIYFVKTDTAGLITSTWQPGAVAGRLTVSPNPVTDVCYVTLPQGCRQLNLRTLQGQTLLTINTTGKSTLELSTNWLPAGLYLLRAETPSGCMIEKILKLKP